MRTAKAKRREADDLRWKAIIEALGQAVLILDPDHTIVFLNHAAVAAIGRPQNEIIGQKCHTVFH